MLLYAEPQSECWGAQETVQDGDHGPAGGVEGRAWDPVCSGFRISDHWPAPFAYSPRRTATRRSLRCRS